MIPPEASDHDPDLAKRLARFTSVVAILLLLAFCYLYAGGPPFSAGNGPDGQPSPTWRAAVIFMMLSSGALGGCLYNFRGITKHMQHQDFFPHYELTYRLRPLSGALCGIFVFALVYGGVLTLTLGQSTTALDHRSVILYVAVAMLSGYGSHEFLRKVKDLNHTLFALSDSERQADAPDEAPPRRDDPV